MCDEDQVHFRQPMLPEPHLFANIALDPVPIDRTLDLSLGNGKPESRLLRRIGQADHRQRRASRPLTRCEHRFELLSFSQTLVAGEALRRQSGEPAA